MLQVLRAPGVLVLLASSTVGRLASAMAALALVRLVLGSGGDYGYAAVLGAAYVLAGMVGQPALSRLIDITGRRRLVLLIAVVVATAGYVGTAVAVAGSPALALASVGAAGLFTPPIEPVLRSLWPDLVDASRLTSAYALDAATQELGFIVGPLLTIVGISAAGVQGNVVLMGLLGLIGAVAFAVHPRVGSRPAREELEGHRRERHGPERHGPERHERERHGTPLRSTALLRLIVVMAAVAVPVGTLTIVATEVARLHGTADASSWAIALNAAGALLGALLFGRFPPSRPAASLIRPLALGLALLYLPTAAWPAPVGLWLVFAFVAGLLLPPLLTQVFAQTPLTVAEHHRTEANAWVVSAFAVGIAAGTLLSGLVLQALPGGPGVVVAVGGASLIGVAGAAQAARGRLSPQFRPQHHARSL